MGTPAEAFKLDLWLINIDFFDPNLFEAIQTDHQRLLSGAVVPKLGERGEQEFQF